MSKYRVGDRVRVTDKCEFIEGAEKAIRDLKSNRIVTITSVEERTAGYTWYTLEGVTLPGSLVEYTWEEDHLTLVEKETITEEGITSRFEILDI